jgi:hypothetical protein
MICLRPVLVVICLLIATASPSLCGEIAGIVRQLDSKAPMVRVAVHAYAQGRSIEASAVSDNDGNFLIRDLQGGDYAVCIGSTDSSRPQVAAVTVPKDGSARVVFGVGPTIRIEGDSWVQGQHVFCQSFRATGLGVTGLKIKAFGPGRALNVQVLEGDGPSGKPIGAARTTVPVGGEGETTVFWAGGEVPTAPGKTYTLRLSAGPGQKWIAALAGRGDVYPLGKAFFANEARPLTDLGFALCEENDNFSTDYAVSAGARAMRVRAVGQTFVARGNDILYAAASLGTINSRAVYVRFSIHEGGPGGKQIGPSKGTGARGDSAVAWLPGEVKVIPGKTYYLHIESFDGALFYASEELESYAKGSAFNDAVADPRYDICAWISGSVSEADQNRLLKHPHSLRQVPLVNSSFENGLAGWMLTKQLGAAVGCDGGVIPAWGRKMFGWTNIDKGEGSATTVYQNVKVTKGKRYSFSGSVYTDHAGGRSSDQKVRLVVDPSGKARFDDLNKESSQWYATEGEWRRGSVEFTAKAATVTVGFELEQRWSLEMCSLYADGARLDEIAEESR